MRTVLLCLLMILPSFSASKDTNLDCVEQYINLAKKRAKVNKVVYTAGAMATAVGVVIGGPLSGSVGGAFLLFGLGVAPMVGMSKHAVSLDGYKGYERTRVFKRLTLREVGTKSFQSLYKKVRKQRPQASVEEVADLVTDGFESGVFCAEKPLMNKKDILRYVVSKL